MRFHSDLWLPAPRDEVFAFFADAANLESITPPWLRFHLDTPTPLTMACGARIDYRLRIHGIPLRWRAEITVWEPPHRFVDEQRRGPYRRWVHTHVFTEERGGTRVSDEVDFEAPGPTFVTRLVVRDVRRIFAYRADALHKLFT
jgi:ligand-binding SRPBCC domain-containing protein